MTIQQLEYIIAVDKHRHFVRAAEACGVSQSTLSALIQKFETELGVTIFNREARPVCPTNIGEKVIAQAKVVLQNANQLQEISQIEKEQAGGSVHIGIIPTVASYIVAKLMKQMRIEYPSILFHVYELTTAEIIKKMCQGDLDMAIMSTPLNHPSLLEVPIYYEKFVAYISPEEPLYQQDEIVSNELPAQHLWILKEGHCFRNQVFNFCDKIADYTTIYEAGSIHTLVNIVDENGGYTIIPELHLQQLQEKQHKNVRKLVNPEPVREISLVIRQDYLHEKTLNAVAQAIRHITPEHMIDERLKKFAIKL